MAEESDLSDNVFDELPKSVRDFRPRCPGCTPAKVADPGARPCSFYDCPGLPAELEVTCDKCIFDFVAGDGQVKCDHSTCPTALRLKANVETYKTWVRFVSTEAGLGA